MQEALAISQSQSILESNYGINAKNDNVANINQSIKNQNLKEKRRHDEDNLILTTESVIASKLNMGLLMKFKNGSKTELNAVVPIMSNNASVNSLQNKEIPIV